jgi:thioredoxin
MKEFRVILIALGIMIFAGCTSKGGGEGNINSAHTSANEKEVPGTPIYLNYETFKEKVWDFEKNPDVWTYKGTEPCVIDFYADWCGPCKRIAPIMTEMAKTFEGRVKIYKIDTQTEKELARVFQISSIPAVLFSPVEGQPMMQVGAYPKDAYVKIIEENLLKPKVKTTNEL